MKGKDGENDRHNGDDSSAKGSIKTQRRKKKGKTNNQPKKPAKRKGIGYLIAYIDISTWQTRMENEPVVVHSLPPALLQPFTCDVEKGLSTGNMQLAIKNIGKGRANDVFPHWMFMKVIPEKRRGDPFVDDPPAVDCSIKIKRAEGFPLDVGVEMFPQIRQSVMSLPKLGKGEPVQLYFSNCVFYWDDQGTQHATCDRYRLDLPSSNPLDRIIGSPSFMCDGQPKSGKFMSDLSGHCEN